MTTTSTIHATTHPIADDARFIRTAGLWCIVGAVIAAVGATVSGIIPSSVPTTDLSYPYARTVYSITQVIWAISQVLMLLGTFGLARSGAVGTSRLGQVGLWIAPIGMALIALFDVGFAFFPTVAADSTPAMILSSAIGLGSTLAGLGFVLTGFAVLQAGRWQGWHRFTPLLCGLYVFIVLTPVLVALPGLFFWGIAGWSACFILLGLALYQQRTASPA